MIFSLTGPGMLCPRRYCVWRGWDARGRRRGETGCFELDSDNSRGYFPHCCRYLLCPCPRPHPIARRKVAQWAETIRWRKNDLDRRPRRYGGENGSSSSWLSLHWESARRSRWCGRRNTERQRSWFGTGDQPTLHYLERRSISLEM